MTILNILEISTFAADTEQIIRGLESKASNPAKQYSISSRVNRLLCNLNPAYVGINPLISVENYLNR